MVSRQENTERTERDQPRPQTPEQKSSSPLISEKLPLEATAAEHRTHYGYHNIVGIDLGTSYSVVAAWNNETGKAEAFDVPGHLEPTCIFLSVVSVTRQGKILVGWQARRNIVANPQNTILEIKRLMGDPQELDLGGRRFTPR